jgi:vitamin B12 transporter
MFTFLRRSAARVGSRAALAKYSPLAIGLLLLLVIPAHAVVVRGRVTDPLGKPIPGARVELIQGGKVAATVRADGDGAFEVRSAESGRFSLLGSSPGFLPGVGLDFYGGELDEIKKDVVLATNTVRQEITVTATGLPTPLPQLTAPMSVLPGEAFSTRIGVVDEMRQTPGAFVVQTGQTGSVASLFLRGGNSTANLVLIDGMPAGDIGGTFDFGTVSSTAISKMEIYRGPNSAMYGTDAGASVVTIDTPRGTTSRPVLTYSGDAGNLHTWRNEGTIGGTAARFDYFGAYSRFDTSNALPDDRYHSSTSAANVGFNIDANNSLRFTIRNADSATGTPDAHDFYGISSVGKQADQDLYAGFTFENRYKDNWHSLVRYAIARKREQAQTFGNVGMEVPISCGPGCSYSEYFGNPVTIRGANGYTASGQAAFFNSNEDSDSNRDQLYFQTDYTFSPHVLALFGFRYDNERGSFNDNDYDEHEAIQRTNFEYNLQFQGEFWDRLFYSAGGAVEKNHLYGIAGTPRLGLAYVPVRPSSGWFHGTRLRANAATGVQEPSLALEYAGLYKQLQENGDTADIEKYNIGPQSAERSRTYDLGIDQNIRGEKLVLKAGYFHNVFDRQLEGVSSEAIAEYFNIGVPCSPPSTGICPLPSIYEAYVNSLAYRVQGAELEINWQPKPRLLVRGGYTFMAERVLQSFASDAVAANQGMPTENPNLPGIAIGAESPLIGARPFRRAPNTGYFDVQYTRKKWNVALKGALASRSDDSTFLDYEDINGGNTLLLPNRDLDFGYAKLDLAGTYVLPHGITVFTQLENLLNNQHIGPIGYPGLPFTFRSGLKLRLGGD